MPTKLEQLKARLDKKQADIEELKASIETEELAEIQSIEFAELMVGRQEEIAVAVKNILDAEPAITLPAGKSFTVSANEDGTLSVSTLAKEKPARKTGGGGGTRSTIEYEGEQITWAELAVRKGILHGAGSAHKAVFTQDKPLHDSIDHDNCPYT